MVAVKGVLRSVHACTAAQHDDTRSLKQNNGCMQSQRKHTHTHLHIHTPRFTAKQRNNPATKRDAGDEGATGALCLLFLCLVRICWSNTGTPVHVAAVLHSERTEPTLYTETQRKRQRFGEHSGVRLSLRAAVSWRRHRTHTR